MIATVIRCDRCKKLVDSPPPNAAIDTSSSFARDTDGFTSGYYSGWKEFTGPDEQHVCDACMWADPRYIEAYGVVGATP